MKWNIKLLKLIARILRLKRTIKVFQRRSLMFLQLLVPINILINRKPEQNQRVRPRQEEKECTEKKREAQRVRHQRQWSKLTGKINSSENGNSHAMICLNVFSVNTEAKTQKKAFKNEKSTAEPVSVGVSPTCWSCGRIWCSWPK